MQIEIEKFLGSRENFKKLILWFIQLCKQDYDTEKDIKGIGFYQKQSIGY